MCLNEAMLFAVFFFAALTAPPCGLSGEVQHAVLALPWHGHFVAVAGQFVVLPVVVVPVGTSFHLIADGEFQSSSWAQNKGRHGQTEPEDVCVWSAGFSRVPA